jgi:TPR repeat protein
MPRIIVLIAFITLAAWCIHFLLRFAGGVEGAKKRAAEGSRTEQYILGTMYETGTKVPKDIPAAIGWYKMAAEQGHVEAQSRLAKLLEQTGDYLNAILWAKKAAEQNDLNALTLLGLMSFNGQGAPRDTKAATVLLQRPADSGDTTAQAALALCYLFDTSEAVNAAKAAEWAKKALPELRKKAEKGDHYAEYTLAVFYREGCGVEKDLVQARGWYRAAAEQGYTPASTSLGLMQAHGIGGAADHYEAFKLLSRAADAGDALAQANAGIMLLNGLGTKADPVAAEKYLRKAAEQGDREAMFGLGAILADGLHGKRDFAEAYFWLMRASLRGHAKATDAAAQVLPTLQTEEAEKIRRRAQN